jgi:DinB superfamily
MDTSGLQPTLLRQFDTAWALTRYHLTGLTTDECLWQPASRGLHVVLHDDGMWRAQWPEHEGYTLGPPSIAWITWHIGFWWSMVLEHSFGDATLTKHDVFWPGTADATSEWITGLATRWREAIVLMTDEALLAHTHTRWPHTDRPFADVVAWANTELTKNAAELGYVRFLYGVRG